jgi:predicted Zn-dependent protease
MKLNKTQIILLIGVVILSTALYFLPKNVLINTKEGANRDKPDTASSAMPMVNQASLKPIETILKESVASLKDSEKNKLELGPDAGKDSILMLMSEYKKYDNKLGIAFCMEKLKGQYPDKEIGMEYYQAFNQSEVDENRKSIAARAIMHLKAASVKDSNNLELKNAMADCYVNTSENPMQGINLLREVMSKDSTNENALFLLGQFAVKSGQMDRARQRFESLVRLYPSNIKYSLYLAQLFSAQGDKDRAVQTLTQAKKYAKRKTASDSINYSIQHLK